MAVAMKRLCIVLAVISLGVLAGAVAYASIPGPDGVIHGCYKTNNPAQGAVIVIDSAASCPNGYAALNWNQAGPPGVSGYEVVQHRYDIVAGTTVDNLTAVAVCTSGKKPTGGGLRIDEPVGQFWYTSVSQPYWEGGTDPIGWFGEAIHSDRFTPTPSNMAVTAFVICVNVT